jgi:GT2 family glycosyltransferase
VSAVDASVIIPTFNRSDALVRTLDALAASRAGELAWEAIVVDDGSTDDTEARVREWMAGSAAPVRYERKANAGPAAARNHGARLAHGRILLFIDNDIVVAPDFIAQHAAALHDHPGCWVIGRIVHPAPLRGTPFGRYRDDVWESFHSARKDAVLAETDGISAANLSLPAEDFRRLGGFDERITIASSEDWDLGFRAREAGIRVLYHPHIVVVHDDWAISLPRFCERQRLYSLSDVVLWRMHGDRSPRAKLVLENSPVRWGTDGPALVMKKAVKALLALRPLSSAVMAAGGLLERVWPDARLTRRAYTLAVSLAIFRGVREGLRRYPASDRR